MIIGITGAARAGKSTVAAYLSERHNLRRVRFAGPLKAMMRSLYQSAGLDDVAIEARLEGSLKEIPDLLLCGKTPRHAMQTLGTEWRDMIGRELWINLWRSDASKGNCVVEDLRFEHEYDAVRKLGGTVIRVDRPSLVRSSLHASEDGLPEHCKVDYVLTNDGTVEDLHRAARDAFFDVAALEY